jgi:hypothetical protein
MLQGYAGNRLQPQTLGRLKTAVTGQNAIIFIDYEWYGKSKVDYAVSELRNLLGRMQASVTLPRFEPCYMFQYDPVRYRQRQVFGQALSLQNSLAALHGAIL